MTTSTSQGRSVPFFFGLFGFLFFICCLLLTCVTSVVFRLPFSVFRLSYAAVISRAAASCARLISPASKLGL